MPGLLQVMLSSVVAKQAKLTTHRDLVTGISVSSSPLSYHAFHMVSTILTDQFGALAVTIAIAVRGTTVVFPLDASANVQVQ